MIKARKHLQKYSIIIIIIKTLVNLLLSLFKNVETFDWKIKQNEWIGFN